ncbi:hypothetical protein RFI_29361 [Reticulomyxa filosa]|uniref:Uncharacterized protein n=1 Tax=Reticulomyxa filosa TaxID=46433 RepID=X6M4R2_RETFI|nr:hypothetical protein RFI_29361 [Reticulomyxa filosa]|eukprot:ETO08030.1 hypothetical protein RFI_29361 [Reticulomyxa filosa]
MTFKLDEKELACRVRKANKDDFTEIFQLISAEPKYRVSDLALTVLFNLVVFGSMSAVAVACFAWLIIFKIIQQKTFSLMTYVLVAIGPACVVYLIALVQAYLLFASRYKKMSHFQALSKDPSNDELNGFVKDRQIFMAFAHKRKEDETRKEEGPCLGVLIMTAYPNFCARIGFNPLRLKEFNKYAQSAMIVEWLVVNEQLLKKSGQSSVIYDSMLRYVCGGDTLNENRYGILDDTSVNYVLCVSDEMSIWQHQCLVENGFVVCGSWEDLHLFGSLPFPTRFHFFLKPMNAVASALHKEKQRREKLQQTTTSQNKQSVQSEKKKKKTNRFGTCDTLIFFSSFNLSRT